MSIGLRKITVTNVNSNKLLVPPHAKSRAKEVTHIDAKSDQLTSVLLAEQRAGERALEGEVERGKETSRQVRS